MAKIKTRVKSCASTTRIISHFINAYFIQLTEPLIVFIVSCPLKSFDSPKSIIFTQLASPYLANMKFSGLMSLLHETWDLWLLVNLPVWYVLAMQVDKGWEQLLHNCWRLTLTQMLPFEDIVEKLTAWAVLENEEADIIPLPDFFQLDNVRMVLTKHRNWI